MAWNELVECLRKECALLEQLAQILEAERLALLGHATGQVAQLSLAKEPLVLALTPLDEERRHWMAELNRSLGGKPQGLHLLSKAAPEELRTEFQNWNRRAADLSEQVFLRNRENGQLFEQGHQALQALLDGLRFKKGKVVLYQPGAQTRPIGGSNFVERIF